MSLVIKFYFTSCVLNMFRTLIHPSSGACDFSIVSPHWVCVLVSMCVGPLIQRPLWQNSTRMTPVRSQQIVAAIFCAGGVCLKIFGLRDPVHRHSKDCYLLSGVMWEIPSS